MSIVTVLERLGHEVKFHEDLFCCGQPAFNAGYWDEARTVARPVVEKLAGDDADAIVIGSGSCGAMLKVFYRDLFANTDLAADATARRRADLGVLRFSGDETGRHRRRGAVPGQGDLSRWLPRAARTEGQAAAARACSRTSAASNWSRCATPRPAAASAAPSRQSFRRSPPPWARSNAPMPPATEAEYIVSNDSSCLMQIQGLLDRQRKPDQNPAPRRGAGPPIRNENGRRLHFFTAIQDRRRPRGRATCAIAG